MELLGSHHLPLEIYSFWPYRGDNDFLNDQPGGREKGGNSFPSFFPGPEKWRGEVFAKAGPKNNLAE